MVDITNPKTKTPFNFREERNQVYYHDFKIYIQGADITPWITSAVNLTKVDREGISSLTFSLSNAMRAFEITEENLNVGKNKANTDPKTGENKVKNEATGRTTTSNFRMNDPYGAGGAYSELAKATIYKNKKESNTNWQHKVAKYGTSFQNKKPNAPIVNADPFNAANTTEATTDRYLFSVGSLVFHKFDPIRMFVLNPLAGPAGTKKTEWTCEFTGYVDTKPFSQSYINGSSVINITCQDIRSQMAVMRTNTNPNIQYGNEKTLFFGANRTNVEGSENVGFLSDFVQSGTPASRGHALYGKTFLDSIKYLIFGIKKNNAFVGGIGKVSLGVVLRYDPEASEPLKKTTLEKWNNIINFGSYPLPKVADNAPEQPEGATTNAKGGPPDTTPDVELVRQGEDAKSGKLGTIVERFLTLGEMTLMGQGTKDGGQFSPDVARVHFLLPPDLGPVSNLIAAATVDARVTARVEWASRLELIVQLVKSIDYQFYISGMGDLIFEFPMYDFMPADYNTIYNKVQTFHGHVMSDAINDEGGTPVSAMEVTSRLLPDEIASDHPSSAGVAPTQGWELRATAFSNVLASRIGVHVETHSLPGITNHHRLAQYALLEFNKRLANFNKFDMMVSYRPFVGLNRPVYHVVKKRIAICDSITYSWKIRQDVSLEMSLSYVRRLEGENFRFITGGEKMPISYSTVFDKTADGTSSGYIEGNGISIITKEIKDGKTTTIKKTLQEQSDDKTQSSEANDQSGG